MSDYTPNTPNTPSPSAAGPVEKKVKHATVASYVGGVALMGVLNGIGDANLIAGFPDWLEVFIAPMLPTAVTFVAAWVAKHTPRPDLGQH